MLNLVLRVADHIAVLREFRCDADPTPSTWRCNNERNAGGDFVQYDRREVVTNEVTENRQRGDVANTPGRLRRFAEMWDRTWDQKPVFRGTRVTLKTMLASLAEGATTA